MATMAKSSRRRWGRTLAIAALSILGVMVLAMVAGLLFADRIAAVYLDRRLQEISGDLGRPVTAGRVDVAVFDGKLRLRDLRVGPPHDAPPDAQPALQLASVAVDVDLPAVLRSRGRVIDVQQAEVEGLRVRVVRHADGSLDWQHMAKKLTPREPKGEPPEVRVDHLVARDGAVTFVQEGEDVPAATVSKIDLRVEDASRSGGMAVQMQAAVLQDEINLEVRWSNVSDTAPQLEARLEPTPLAPFAPFLSALLPASEALQAGVLSATVEVGDPEPAGSSDGSKVPIAIDLRLRGGRFAKGEPFDAKLVAGGVVSREERRATIEQARLEVADMAAVLSGQVDDAWGPTEQGPRLSNVELRSDRWSFDRLCAIYPALDAALAPLTLRGSVSVHAEGSGTRGSQQVELDLVLDEALVRVSENRFHKARGTPMRAHVSGTRKGEALRAKGEINLASLDASGEVTLQGDQFAAEVTMPAFAVRPLAQLLPQVRGRVGNARLAGNVRAEGTRDKPSTVKVTVSQLEAVAGRSNLRGRATVENLDAPRFTLHGESSHLNVDDFLVKSTRAKSTSRAAKRALPARWQRAHGTIELQVSTGRAGRVPYEDLTATLVVDEGRAIARSLKVNLLGGQLSGDGTEIPLFAGAGAYRLKGEIAQAELPQVLERLGGAQRMLQGTLGATFDLSTAGLTVEAITSTLDGRLEGRVQQGKFLRGNGYGALLRELSVLTTVPGLAKSLGQASGASQAAWPLGTVSGAVSFENGTVVITRPLTAQTPQGELRVDGSVALTGRANLRCTLGLKPDAVEELLGLDPDVPRIDLGVDEPIPVSFRVQGTLRQPRFAFGSLEEVLTPLAQAYLEGAAERRMRRGVGEVWKRVGPDILKRPPGF